MTSTESLRQNLNGSWEHVCWCDLNLLVGTHYNETSVFVWFGRHDCCLIDILGATREKWNCSFSSWFSFRCTLFSPPKLSRCPCVTKRARNCGGVKIAQMQHQVASSWRRLPSAPSCKAIISRFNPFQHSSCPTSQGREPFNFHSVYETFRQKQPDILDLNIKNWGWLLY